MKYSRKKTYKPKKRYYKKSYSKKKIENFGLTTKRWTSFTALTGNDTIPQQINGIYFKLNDLAGSTDFTNLFERYMIAGIQYRFCLKVNPDLVTTATNRGLYPYLKWVHDHDDVTVNSATLPTEIIQYPGMKEFIFSPDHPNTKWYYLKPAVANSVYGTLVTTAYAPAWKVWCDSQYPGIQHYGIKVLCDQLYTGQQIYLECKYIIKLKGVN